MLSERIMAAARLRKRERHVKMKITSGGMIMEGIWVRKNLMKRRMAALLFTALIGSSMQPAVLAEELTAETDSGVLSAHSQEDGKGRIVLTADVVEAVETSENAGLEDALKRFEEENLTPEKLLASLEAIGL